jgi:predicted nucleotidyltransferase
LTRDIDFLSDQEPEGQGFPLSFGGVSLMVNNVPVDFIVRRDQYQRMYEAALERAVVKIIGGARVPVVRASDMMALKLASARQKDVLDFQFLATSLDPKAISNARRFVKKHLGFYAADDFDRLVEEAKWMASKGR